MRDSTQAFLILKFVLLKMCKNWLCKYKNDLHRVNAIKMGWQVAEVILEMTENQFKVSL
jgi:hypothetical protein